ncbi:hypothetical protein BDK51DRAFT_27364 [Blyttiomyces helicus]|uniref:Uncharacterized protein n=1 Tax=Blyttiomyces helicus TaxID=388810 RepID=A0A4P9WC81_9FUNG|nr:hypothetical protein BDK51DRAFT_27364 [Blyttiomyces helicus]|eukprot:RKO88490.1 hypothetical protein BDK51DRAFT_27364 [Blyttiomyces helicus]
MSNHSPATRATYLPTQLLQQVFREFPNSRIEGSQCSDIRAVSLVCRAWDPAASARIWTHVVLREDRALGTFIKCVRASRAKRAVIVRILEFRFNHWDARAHSDFAILAPLLRGLRQFVGGDRLVSEDLKLVGPRVSTIALFLSSCPDLVALDVPAPGAWMEKLQVDEGEDLMLASKYEFELDPPSSPLVVCIWLLLLLTPGLFPISLPRSFIATV